MTSRTLAVWTATAATVAFVLSRHQARRRDDLEPASAAQRYQRSRTYHRRHRDRHG